MRFKNLRSLIDDSQGKLFQLKQQDVAVHRSGCAHKNPCCKERVLQICDVGTLLDSRTKQFVLVFIGTTAFVSDSDEINSFLVKFAANLVNRPVSIGKKQDGSIGFQQFLFDGIEQSIRCFSRAWRNEERRSRSL